MTGNSIALAQPLLRSQLKPAITIFLVIAGLFLPRICAAGRDPLDGPSAPALVRCDPPTTYGYTTGTATVDLYIESVTDLYGADLRVTFDPAIAHVVDHDSLAAGTQIEILRSFLDAGFVPRDDACNVAVSGDPICPSAGLIWYAATQVNPALPVSGSGPVARIVFQPSTAGHFQMDFTYRKLSDREGTEIAAETQSCFVEFYAPTALDVDGLAAVAGDDGVTVRWSALTVDGLAGFNVYRGRSDDDRLRLNASLIPAADGGSDAAFAWYDRTSLHGQLYWVESVPLVGPTILHGPVAPLEPLHRVLFPLLLLR